MAMNKQNHNKVFAYKDKELPKGFRFDQKGYTLVRLNVHVLRHIRSAVHKTWHNFSQVFSLTLRATKTNVWEVSGIEKFSPPSHIVLTVFFHFYFALCIHFVIETIKA